MSVSAYTTYSTSNTSGFTLPPLGGKPPQADRDRATFLSAFLGRDVPGQNTSNAFAQVDNYIGAQYVAIQAIMKAMSGATLKIMQRKTGVVKKSLGGDESESDEWQPAAPDHQACRLFDFPNPTQTTSAMLAEYALMLKLTGRGFLWGVPGRRTGKPTRLWVLSSPYVTAGYQISEQYPKGQWMVNLPAPMTYGYTTAGVVWLDAREVCELRLTNPRYYWAGYSPLQAGAYQIDVLNAIVQSQKSMMDRGSTIDGMVAISGASEAQLTAYQRQVDEKYTGQARGARILFTSGDDIKATALSGFAPKDMAFSEGYDQYTKFVSSLMGTPGQITGLVDAQSYASFYAAQLQFQTTELQPLCKMIAEFWTLQLIRPNWGSDIKLVIEPPRIDDVERADRQYEQDKDILTVNERRRMRNHEEVPDGDVPAAIWTADLQAKQQAEQQAQMQPQPGMEGGQPPEDPNQPPQQAGGQGFPDDLMGGAVLSALGMDSPDAAPVVQKSLRRYFTQCKALQVERVSTPSGKVAAKYSGSDRVYYGKQAEAMLSRTARNEDAGMKVTEEGQEPESKPEAQPAAGKPTEAPKPETPKQKFTLKFQSKTGPGSLDFDNEQDARDAAIAFGFPGHELHGPAGKLAEGKGGKWSDGSDDGKPTAVGEVVKASKTVPQVARPVAAKAAPKLAAAISPVAQQIADDYPVAEIIPQLKQPRGLATKFADKFHGKIAQATGLSPKDAHTLARNLAEGFARGLLMKLTKTYIPMQTGNGRNEEDIRAEERGKLIQYEDDTPIAKPVKPGKVGASGKPLATLKNGPPRPATPLGVRKKSLKRYLQQRLRVLKAFNPDEPRDASGEWTSGGGSSGKKTAKAKGGKPAVDYDSHRDEGYKAVPGFHKTRAAAEAAGDAVAKYPDSKLWVALKKPGAEPAETPKPAEAPKSPATSLLSLPVKEFAAKVQNLADGVKHAVFAGDNEVFISDVYDAVKQQDPSLTIEDFKAKLIDAVRAGHVDMARLDTITAGHPADVKRSEIQAPSGTYHVMRVDQNKGRVTKHNSDEIAQAWKDHTAKQYAGAKQ